MTNDAKLFLASDHGGFTAKNNLLTWLQGEGWSVIDCGPATLDPDDDYPPYAAAVARQVSADPKSRGILLCRSGQGMVIAANKFPHIRAVLVWNKASAVAGRGDSNANILCLPADALSESELEELVQLWLETEFKTDDRYLRRVAQIGQIEQETMRK